MENYEKAIFQPQAIASCSVTTTKGYHIPSIDTMRIRVIFAKFQDDNDNVSYWPQAGFPSSALSFIDSTASQNSTHKLNLTNYYRTFSDGQYILIGKVDTVTLNQSMLNSLYMGTSGTYRTKTYNANKAVLNSLSGRPGFELYDDWTRIDNNHSKCPDSIPQADMIIIIWRSNRFGAPNIGGFAGFGSGTSFSINGIKINPGSLYSGSAVSMIKEGGFSNIDQLFNVTIHELGHYHLGGNHPHIQDGNFQYQGRHNFPSLMAEGHPDVSVIPNPFEREYLGWITPVTLTTGTDLVGTIGDHITTGDAYKWSRTNTDDVLYFFNSQKLNQYDNITQNVNDKGVFVMHHRYSSRGAYMGNSYNNRLISSEGDYDWQQVNPYFVNTNEPSLTMMFARLKPNPIFGDSHLTMLDRDDRCANSTNVQWLGALANTALTGVAPSESTSCYWISQPYAYADTSYNYLGNGFISSFSYENNRAYFSAITNPMAKQYQHTDSTTATALPISMHVAPTNIDGSIDVTFRFDEDPFDIDSDRVWSGEIFIPDGQLVVVSDNATLTILPDTRIFLGKNNARIATTGGGKIIALGTQNKPITFTTSYDTESWSHANEWGQLFLGSGGNRFEWCVFEYGTKHIEVASRDNEIRNSIFRNGWRGISSYSNQSGSGPTNSEVLIDQVLMTGNRTVGFVGYYSDSKVSNVTITHNGEAGAWYEYANGLSLHKSRIDSNATSSSTRSGVEANQGSVVHLLRYHSGSYLQGDNSIRAQPQYQVYRGNGSTLHMGNYYTIGEPGWSNIEGGSSYLVRNYGSGLIIAHENWWGISEPESSNFYGSVDYNFFQYSAVNVFEATSLPAESHYYTNQYLKVRPQTLQESSDLDRKAEQNRGRIREHASQLRQQLNVASANPDDILVFLDLHTLMWDPQWYGADVDANRAVLSNLYAEVTKQSTVSSSAVRVIELQLREWVSTSPKRAAQEALVLLESQQHPHIRLAATQVLMSISEQNGNLVAARSYLSQVSELQRSVGHQEEMVETYASMMEGIFATRPEQRFLNGSSMSEQSPSKSTEDPKVEPVLTVFPNPFNPETVVTIELRSEQRVRIEVYNTLGQRVQTLLDAPMTTGRHSVRMDGSKLSSGVYLIRVHTGQQVITHRVTLIK